MSMTDVALVALGSYFVIRGLFRGLSGEIFSLVSVVGGFYCSLTFSAPLANVLIEKLGVSRLVGSAFSMLGIFLAICAVCGVARKGLKTALRGTNLTWLDKALGACSGLVKIYLVSLVALVLGMIFSPITGDAWMRESKTLSAAAKTWPYVSPLFDRIGVLPDLSDLQREAREYIWSVEKE